MLKLSYNIRDDEIVICNGTKSYIYTQFGMGCADANIDSLVFTKDGLLVHSPAALAQQDITFRTDIISFESIGLKSLEFILFNGICSTDVYVTPKYRVSKTTSFLSAPTLKFNQEGYCRIGIRGIEFILDFYIPNYSELSIQNIILGIQYVDKRFKSGVAIEQIKGGVV